MNSNPSESDSWIELLAWAELHKKQIVIGVLAAVVLGGAWYLYQWSADQKQFAANQALISLRAPNDPKSPSPGAASYLDVANKYKGTDAAARAAVLAAGELFSTGKYVEAQQQFDHALKQSGQKDLQAVASLGVASCLEAQGKTAEALTAYQTLARNFPKESAATEAQFAAARIHEANQRPAEALRIYEELAKATPPTASASEANQLKAKLLDSHPELKKEEPPPVLKPSDANAVVPPTSPAATNTAPVPKNE